MLAIEISPNPNCDPVELRVFHDLELPRHIVQVRVEGSADVGDPQWYTVTGWTTAGATCPALARRVDDSGEGVVLLVSGGDAGLRLRPVGSGGTWRLDDAGQRGESFLLLADDGSIRYEESA